MSCQRYRELGANWKRAANVAGSSEQIGDELPTLPGARSKLETSRQRCRELGANWKRAADVAGSSEQIVSGFFANCCSNEK